LPSANESPHNTINCSPEEKAPGKRKGGPTYKTAFAFHGVSITFGSGESVSLQKILPEASDLLRNFKRQEL
jgi:hypothetical protein